MHIILSLWSVMNLVRPCRLYVDESGDHTSCHIDNVGKRYLGVTGVMFEDAAYRSFQRALERFKKDYFGDDPDEPAILHREDIMARRGIFTTLRDEEISAAFNRSLLDLIGAAKFRVFAVVLDKHRHSKSDYRRLTHPYHYCLHALLERYCGYLHFRGLKGDVLAEARGNTEDRALSAAFMKVWESGTSYLPASKAQTVLTSRNLKLKAKQANVAGLQLADLVAHPLTRDVLVAHKRLEGHGSDFAKQFCGILESKYNRQAYDGRILGYGRVLLD